MVEKWRSIPRDVDVLLYKGFHETYGVLCEFLKDTPYKVEADVNMASGWEEVSIVGEGRTINLFSGSILIKDNSNLQVLDKETFLRNYKPAEKEYKGYITW